MFKNNLCKTYNLSTKIFLKKRKLSLLFQSLAITILILLFFSAKYSQGIIIDKVAAYVNETAITLSDIEFEQQKMRNKVPSLTQREIIESMINRILLIKEAKKIKIDSHSEDELINLYLEVKIKSRLFIKEDILLDFYRANIEQFKGQDYLIVKDEIEKYLIEKQFNEILKQHLDELRKRSEIKILIKYE